MADYDRRDSRGYGGGHGGGGRDRKRKRNGKSSLADAHEQRLTEHVDDEDFERRQRPRADIPPGTRIRRGLLEIGDDIPPNMAPRSPQSIAEQVAKIAVENWEDDFVKDTFCTVSGKMRVHPVTKKSALLIPKQCGGAAAQDPICCCNYLVRQCCKQCHWSTIP